MSVIISKLSEALNLSVVRGKSFVFKRKKGWNPENLISGRIILCITWKWPSVMTVVKSLNIWNKKRRRHRTALLGDFSGQYMRAVMLPEEDRGYRNTPGQPFDFHCKFQGGIVFR